MRREADVQAISRVAQIAEAVGRGQFTPELLARHPRGVGLVVSTYELESFVWLGGLGHYLYYLQAELIDLAIEGYDEFKCPLHASWTRRAREQLATQLGPLWDRRASAFAEVEEAARKFDDEPWMAELNRQFFAIEEKENTWLLRDAAVLADPARYTPNNSEERAT
jgi:hypothetical protein